MLTVQHLSCRKGERLLWQDLNFAVSPGQLLQIAGANGSGKTSLLRVLTGLAPAHTGEVSWQGVAIGKRKSAYQQQLHYLGHQAAVKSELTVQENLRFNLQKTAKKSVNTAIEQVGLTTHRDHFGHQLSQGQKQRVALARLLLNPARLWILDEPLAGLDTDMIEHLQQIFAEQLQQGGMIILTTHRPLTLPALSPEIIKLC